MGKDLKTSLQTERKDFTNLGMSSLYSSDNGIIAGIASQRGLHWQHVIATYCIMIKI